VPSNTKIIKEHGFAELRKAILEGTPSNKSVCYDQLMSKNIKYGTQIIIEYDAEYDTQRTYCLDEFPRKFQLNNSFILTGIVARLCRIWR